MATSFPNVKYYFQNNNGLSSARNTGIKKAQGDFILFNDADDTLPKTALEYHLKCYSANPDCILISGPNIRIDDSGEPLPYKSLPAGPAATNTYESLLTKNYIGMPGTAIIRRENLISVGGYDESLDSCEDFDMYLKLARNHQFGYHTNISGYYRVSTNSMSSNSIRMLKRSVEVFQRQSSFIADNKSYEKPYQIGLQNNIRMYSRQIATNAALALFNRDVSSFYKHTTYLIQHYPLIAMKSFAYVFIKTMALLFRKMLGLLSL